MGNTAAAPALGGPAIGYRVLDVQDHSPGALAGLVSHFDVIVVADGSRLSERNSLFTELIRGKENRPLELQVYNTKMERLRDVKLTPRRGWGGNGLLGITIRYDAFSDDEANVLHVLDVMPRSPAAAAGLVPYEDYILGTPRGVLETADDLGAEATDSLGRPLYLFVYNLRQDTVRLVRVVPTTGWGGDGVLGCNVGQGYLHQLPHSCRQTTGTSVPMPASSGPAYAPDTWVGTAPTAADGEAAPDAPAAPGMSDAYAGVVAPDATTGVVAPDATALSDAPAPVAASQGAAPAAGPPRSRQCLTPTRPGPPDGDDGADGAPDSSAIPDAELPPPRQEAPAHEPQPQPQPQPEPQPHARDAEGRRGGLSLLRAAQESA